MNELIIRWLAAILILLLVPYGIIILLLIFIIQFYRNKLEHIDLLLLYFLIFFIQKGIVGSPTDTEGPGMASLKYILILVSLFPINTPRYFSFKPLFIKAFCLPFLFIFLILHSLFFSIAPFISLFEIISLGIMILFAYKNTYYKNIVQRKKSLKNIEAMYIAIIICSTFSFLFPAIAYMRNGMGFQGISVHPNAFGIVLAPFCGLLLVRLFDEFAKKDLFLFIFSLLYIVLSQSRTSLLSVLFGFVGIILINPEIRKKFTKKSLFILLISGWLLVLYYNIIIEFFMGFMNKSNAATIQESVMDSRGGIILDQLENIENHTFFGIGFKMPSDMVTPDALSFEGGYEKGNMILASFEEIGLIGTIVLIITLIAILNIKDNTYNLYLILPLVALCTTMGEATLFSIGGAGIIVWTFIFLSMHEARLRKKRIIYYIQ